MSFGVVILSSCASLQEPVDQNVCKMPDRPKLTGFKVKVMQNGDTRVCTPQDTMEKMHRYIMELENSFERCGGTR